MSEFPLAPKNSVHMLCNMGVDQSYILKRDPVSSRVDDISVDSRCSSRIDTLSLYQSIRQLGSIIKMLEETLKPLMGASTTQTDASRPCFPDHTAFHQLHSEIMTFVMDIYNKMIEFLAGEDHEFGIEDRVAVTQEFRQNLTRLQITQCRALSKISCQVALPSHAVKGCTAYALVTYQRQIIVYRLQRAINEINDIIRYLSIALKEACREARLKPALKSGHTSFNSSKFHRPFLEKNKHISFKEHTKPRVVKNRRLVPRLVINKNTNMERIHVPKLLRRKSASTILTIDDRDKFDRSVKRCAPFVVIGAITLCLILIGFIIWSVGQID